MLSLAPHATRCVPQRGAAVPQAAGWATPVPGAGARTGGFIRRGLRVKRLTLRQRRVVRQRRREDGLFTTLLQRFFSQFLGMSTTLVLARNLLTAWAAADLVYPWLLSRRILRYHPPRRARGTYTRPHPWLHGAFALGVATRIKDPVLLLNWAQVRLRRMSMFLHRRFFRVMGILLSAATRAAPQLSRLRGMYLYLVGKISVTGNSMSRSYLVRGGQGGSSSLELRAAEAFGLVHTRTGCLGLTLRFFY